MFGPLGADKYHEYCRDIRQSGQYLLDVINDILDMSKIEAGRIRLDLEHVELGPLARRRHARRRRRAPRTSGSSSPSSIAPGIRLRGRPARAQADRAQSAVQRGEVHARRRPHHGARPRCRRRGRASPSQDTGIGIPQRRAEEARPAVRAGREPAHQDPSRLGAGARDRQIADRTARRRDAHPLEARLRHDRGGAPAARPPAGIREQGAQRACCLKRDVGDGDRSNRRPRCGHAAPILLCRCACSTGTALAARGCGAQATPIRMPRMKLSINCASAP